jgi:hypothetical protein
MHLGKVCFLNSPAFISEHIAFLTCQKEQINMED